MTDPKRKRQLISETASSFPKQNAYTPFRMMNTGINNHIYSQGMLDKHRHSPIKSDKEAKKTVSGCTMKWQGLVAPLSRAQATTLFSDILSVTCQLQNYEVLPRYLLPAS